MITPVKMEDSRLWILDQSLLPGQEHYIELRTKEEIWAAIKKLQVRGAPAIGVCQLPGFCQRFSLGEGIYRHRASDRGESVLGAGTDGRTAVPAARAGGCGNTMGRAEGVYKRRAFPGGRRHSPGR